MIVQSRMSGYIFRYFQFALLKLKVNLKMKLKTKMELFI